MADEEMTLREERKLLMDTAAMVMVELRRITTPVNALINKIIEAGDEMKIAVADEFDDARGTVARKVTYKHLAEKAAPAPEKQVMNDAGEVVTKRQRKCSICHKPGHRSTTCPNGRGK